MSHGIRSAGPAGPETSAGLFLHCRAGFETECAEEARQRAEAAGAAVQAEFNNGGAHVILTTRDAEAAERIVRHTRLADLIFTRQWFLLRGRLTGLPRADRITPLEAAIRTLALPAGELFLEAPDSEAGRPLQPLCKALGPRLAAALGSGAPGPPQGRGSGRLHVCFTATDTAWLGLAEPGNSAPWPMGIPRLKASREAPSRSSLKLEEAFLHFLSDAERARALRAGMRAVDLGAAPGGWTWQLVRRGLRVTAVDNGALAPALLASGAVEHRRADGFRYEPRGTVDWLVCDMVEQPARIAELVARWATRGWCRRAIFNLKLPMKRRLEETRRCLDHIRGVLDQHQLRYTLLCKQLYHDREEVTGYLRPGKGDGGIEF